MKKLNLLRLFLCAMLVSASMGFSACTEKEPNEVELPTLEVSPATIAFDGEGGAKSFQITTTGKWSITGAEGASWIAITPALTGNGNATITATAAKSTASNSVTLKVKVFATVYGIEKEIASKDVKITQTPGGDKPSEDVIYGNNFDKELVTKTFGPSGTAWPFLDQFEGWKNAVGTGISTVTYEYKNVSARASGKLSGGYDNASGQNKIFFGAAPATFSIDAITMPSGKVNYKLIFGAAYYDGNTSDNIFKPESFDVQFGNGTEWSDKVTYEKIGGSDTVDPFWVQYAVNFTLKAAVEKLSIRFTATASSFITIDDVVLTEGIGGQQVEFNGGGAVGTRAVTIPELIGLMTDKQVVLDSANDCTFEAVVVTDKAGGNFNKNNLMVMTPGATTGNNGIVLYGSGKYTDPNDAGFTFVAGDKVKVTLKAGLSKIVNYEGLYEATGGIGNDWVLVEKIGTAKLEPIEITADKLAQFQAMPVAIKNVTSPATANLWCETDKFGLHTFTVNGASLSVFVQANMPGLVGINFKAGATGTIVGAASVKDNVGQICPQSVDNVAPFLSGAPAISTIDPSSLSFGAEAESQTVTVTTVNADGYTLNATATAPFTAVVGQNGVITVSAPALVGEGLIGELTVTLEKSGNVVDTKTVALKQQAAVAGNAMESDAAFVVAVDNSADAYYSLTTKDGVNSTANGENATGFKLGTGSKAGVFTSAAVGVAGNKTLSFYGLAWKAKTATLYVKVNGGGDIDGAANIELKPNDGVTGNPPFTIVVADDGLYSIKLTGLTAESTITFSTSADFTAAADKNAGRAVVFGANLK